MLEEFFQRNHRPLWALKIATTLDGAMADHRGISKWITGTTARQVVMQQRQKFPAIAVGSTTVMMDNPSLTIRNYKGQVSGCSKRLILDGHNRLLPKIDSLRVFNDSYTHQSVYFYGQPIPISVKEKLEKRNITLQRISLTEGHISLDSLNLYLQKKKIYGIYIEAGHLFTQALLKQSRIDYLYHFRGAKIMGDRGAQHLNTLYSWKNFTTSELGGDFLQEGWLK